MSGFLTAGYIVLGLGACDNSANWCNDEYGLGTAGAEVVLAETGRHSFNFSARHYSGIKEHDAGVNVFMGEYRFKLFSR